MSFKLCLAVLLLAGCSRLEMAYTWADTAIIYTANKYFDLSREQEKKAKQLIDRDLKTLVQTQGPVLKSFMLEIISLINNPNLTQSQFNEFFTRGRLIFYEMITVAEDSALELARTLTPIQLDHFSKKLKKEVEKKQKELASSESQKRELKKRSLRWMEMMGLKLDPSQEVAFGQFLQNASYPFLLEQKNRLLLGEQFLKAAKGPSTLKEFIHTLFHESAKIRDSEYQKALDQERLRLRDFQWRLLQSLTPKQKKEIESKIRQQLEELEKIQKRAA